MGTSWANLQALQTTFKMKCDNKTELRTCLPTLGAKIQPKWHPTRIQISDDFQDAKHSFSRGSWNALGLILGHFEGHLWVQKNAPVLENIIREQN